MNNVVCHGRIALDNLRPLIAHCHFSAEARVLMEQLPHRIVTKPAERQALLVFKFFDPELDFEQYDSGRIFQQSGELRWEKEGEQFKIVYVGDDGELAETIEMLLRDYHERNESPEKLYFPRREAEKKYYLFGTRLDDEDLKKIGPTAKQGDFAEGRIQRLLRYPLGKEDTKGPISLIVQEMYDEATEQLVLFRFVGLDEERRKGAEKGQEGTEG